MSAEIRLVRCHFLMVILIWWWQASHKSASDTLRSWSSYHPAHQIRAALSIISICDAHASQRPISCARPHMSISPAQYSTPGLLTTAHTLHVHPTHTGTPSMKTCLLRISAYCHTLTFDALYLLVFKGSHIYMSILHTKTPSMTSCLLSRKSAYCPTLTFGKHYMRCSSGADHSLLINPSHVTYFDIFPLPF